MATEGLAGGADIGTVAGRSGGPTLVTTLAVALSELRNLVPHDPLG